MDPFPSLRGVQEGPYYMCWKSYAAGAGDGISQRIASCRGPGTTGLRKET